jgi:hypothetical protein
MIAESVVENKHQCTKFKLRPDKKWEHFAGKKLDLQAKLNGTIMCPRWHTRGNCFKDCKYKDSHVACSEVPGKAKQAHLKWLAAVCRSE